MFDDHTCLWEINFFVMKKLQRGVKTVLSDTGKLLERGMTVLSASLHTPLENFLLVLFVLLLLMNSKIDVPN